MRYRLVLPLLVAAGLVMAAGAQTAHPAQANDWLMFGGSLTSPSVNVSPGGINAANAAKLARREVTLPGTVDSSAVYLHGAMVKGARHNAVFLTGLYGKTMAIDADSGKMLWVYTPASYSKLAGTRQVTNASPTIDPGLQSIYAASPDGFIQKLAIGDGHLVWRTSVTKLPLREKLDSGVKVYHGRVIAVTAGYNGDRPPYVGHVAVLNAGNGRLEHVWNSLCSNRTGLIDPSTCSASDSAIWGRPGAQIDPANGDILIATGNAPWNGKTNWGDAVVELNATATKMLGNYTPSNTDELNQDDLDVGSTAPVWLGNGLIAQGGKDGTLRLLSMQAMAGTAPHKDHELQIVDLPSNGSRRGKMLFSQPAVWRHDGKVWVFAADGAGTAAWTLQAGKLVAGWKNSSAGTSPFVAGGLLYVFDPQGALNVYEAASGKLVTALSCPRGHWQSPVVVDGHIFITNGNANRRTTSGTLTIWSVR
ncbi:MAG: PQQ-binding-like beta-propeller repeat protein [Terriglobales bacterium]